MLNKKYLMENSDETRRLELKTGFEEVETQARWAGIRPGMRVADIGCGSGKTTAFLGRLVEPDGEVLGIDGSAERIAYADEQHRSEKVRFECRDIYSRLSDLGPFDFIWVRFFLEYHRARSFELVKSFSELLSAGGILCLVDLDHNSLNHYGLSARLERAIMGSAKSLEEQADWDPYIGRKLYSFLYDLGFEDIDVRVDAHHLIFGKVTSVDEFNWITKVAVAGRDSGYSFEEYEGGFEEFFQECRAFFSDPRRFTYTPVISCRGRKQG